MYAVCSSGWRVSCIVPLIAVAWLVRFYAWRPGLPHGDDVPFWFSLTQKTASYGAASISRRVNLSGGNSLLLMLVQGR